MRRTKHYHKIIVGCAVLVQLVASVAKVLNAQTVPGTDFLIKSENVLCNAISLEPLFEKLYALERQEATRISIVHIGDSHIQADYLTEVVRRNLQLVFGNAGRGLVVPYRVAGTNEPANFRTFSDGGWTSQRIVHSSKPLPIGIGGITLSTGQEGTGFSLRMADPQMDYSFNSVTLFAQHDEKSFCFSIMDSARTEIGRIEAPQSPYFARTKLSKPIRHIIVQGVRERPEQNHATVFGLNLENGSPGLLYHAIGVNGAKYEHYNRAQLFSRQTALLSPDLFIISLGTNESVEYPQIKSNLQNEIRTLVESLSLMNPQASFILVTPPDAFARNVKPNPGIEMVRNKIITFAVENGLAFWDMFRVNGGKDSAAKWRQEGLMRPDGIHFTRQGYALQGELLFEAIMKSYSEYVAVRNP